ncbi:MAG: hypothetical protein AB7S50_13030 [Bacteroidales bacterium]
MKSEYLVFCSKCNKKLDNNYSSWSIINSDKTFEDFKNQVCTTNIEEPVKTNTKKHKIKGLKYWIGFTVAFAIFYAIGHFAGEAIIGVFNKPAIEKALVEVANTINKNCPMMIDSETRLDNAVALPNNVFQYNYTLINMVKESTNIDEMRQYLEPNIINFVKTQPDMKTMRDNKTTVNYSYKDKKGVFLLTISVTPNQYE